MSSYWNRLSRKEQLQFLMELKERITLDKFKFITVTGKKRESVLIPISNSSIENFYGFYVMIIR